MPRSPLGRRVRLRSGETGTAVRPFRDHHVHLDLIDASRLSGLAAVVDLGGDPGALPRWRANTALPHIDGVGAFLTAPGGYPSDRAWAPARSVEVVSEPSAAAAAVARQHAAGATAIKVMLNADAGPALEPGVLAALVIEAHRLALPVVAHVEGAGMAAASLQHDVDVMAHTPWTERLDDDLVAHAAARQLWISTLDIHGFGTPTEAYERAMDNLRRFAAAGGRVLYGTDLGNGPLPEGVNPRELAGLVRSGLDAERVLTALTAAWPSPATLTGLASFVPGRPPEHLENLPDWLATARTITTHDLAEEP